VEIHESARKRGVADQDILHAIHHALAIEDAGEDPDPLITAEGAQIVIHAMPMRDKYARLLEPRPNHPSTAIRNPGVRSPIATSKSSLPKRRPATTQKR
jgi:hypothetical protein